MLGCVSSGKGATGPTTAQASSGEPEYTISSTTSGATTVEGSSVPPHGFRLALTGWSGEVDRGGELVVSASSQEGLRGWPCSAISVVVDGTSWPDIPVQSAQKRVGKSLTQTLGAVLSSQQLEGLMRAVSVEMSACEHAFGWPRPLLEKARELWQVVHHGQPVPEPEPEPTTSTAPDTRSCPGGVTTSGRCCTQGRACGGSCISRDRQCHH